MTLFPNKNEIEKELKSYIEDELVKDINCDDKKGVIIIKLDTIIQEYKLTIQVPKEETGEYLISYEGKKLKKTGNLKSVLKSCIEIFVEIRDKFIEESNKEETPKTAKEPIFEDFEDEHILTKHSYEANLFFGKNATSVIKELEQVRLTVFPDLLKEEIQKRYEITKGNQANFGLQFAPDYTDNSKPPSLQFKKESIQGYNTGFTEHVVNMTRRFLQERWNQIKNGQKLCLIETSFSLNIDKKEKIKNIKYYLDKKQEILANALSLYYCNFKRDDAALLIMDSGGIFEELPNSDGKINFLIELLVYLYLRMMDITESCLICDEKIKYQNVKDSPTICTNFKCQFEYIEMHVCTSIHVTICPSSIYQDLIENEQVVDLLICMTYSAAASNRRNLIFNPFPNQFISNNNRNYDAVLKILNNFPSVKDMLKKSKNEKELKSFLGSDCFELLSWILTEKRVALLKIPEKKRISEMSTDFQYLMLCDDPDKMSKFNSLRSKYGSYFAFHG